MGFVKVRGLDFYYEEKGEGLPILLILRPAAPPRRGGPFSAIWPAWAGSSRTTGVGTAGRGEDCPLGLRACGGCRSNSGSIGG